LITENLSTLKIHKLTQAQYDRELKADNIDAAAMYLTPEEDHVVEQGVKQGAAGATWTYRKWNSGLAECWFNDTFSVDSCTEEFGGFYITPTSDSVGYPFSFLEIPTVSATAYGASKAYCWTMLHGLGGTGFSPNIKFVSNVNGHTDIPYSLSVIGKWK
jgi:hypothetical protein